MSQSWDKPILSQRGTKRVHCVAPGAHGAGRRHPLEASGPEAEDAPEPELFYNDLVSFVEEHLPPSYRRSLSGTPRTWCPSWWKHEEAISRSWRIVRMLGTVVPFAEVTHRLRSCWMLRDNPWMRCFSSSGRRRWPIGGVVGCDGGQDLGVVLLPIQGTVSSNAAGAPEANMMARPRGKAERSPTGRLAGWSGRRPSAERCRKCRRVVCRVG
ncbi:DUF4913 domain-containing protein [Arthrobacter sp. 9AX]|uniref:DUF4913 domain-containing protein n=1 Tax=Arthrobacter sp. 9AX TaxID=2653131 RepID=UPI003FA462EC